jgi:hypothetical protein
LVLCGGRAPRGAEKVNEQGIALLLALLVDVLDYAQYERG